MDKYRKHTVCCVRYDPTYPNVMSDFIHDDYKINDGKDVSTQFDKENSYFFKYKRDKHFDAMIPREYNARILRNKATRTNPFPKNDPISLSTLRCWSELPHPSEPNQSDVGQFGFKEMIPPIWHCP